MDTCEDQLGWLELASEAYNSCIDVSRRTFDECASIQDDQINACSGINEPYAFASCAGLSELSKRSCMDEGGYEDCEDYFDELDSAWGDYDQCLENHLHRGED